MLCDYANVDTIFATIVFSKLATWHELDTIYNYSDALDLYEIILVNRENEARAYKEQARNSK